MAATGILAAAYENVCTRLADAGMVVVRDPRNARPMSVFVELPTAPPFNSNIVDVTIVCRILAGGPGDRDAADYLLSQADVIHENVEGITDIRGKGLMLAIELDRPCAELVKQCLDQGLLINVTAGNVIRLLPPYVMTQQQADRLVSIVSDTVKTFVQDNEG